MGDPRHDLGRRAEAAVAAWLEGSGWHILARRQRSSVGGEVDLIALDPDVILVAVEVRARHSARTGSAAFSVDARRLVRMKRTLAAFAAGYGGRHAGLRIDLVTLEPEPGSGSGRWRLRRLPGIGGE